MSNVGSNQARSNLARYDAKRHDFLATVECTYCSLKLPKCKVLNSSVCGPKKLRKADFLLADSRANEKAKKLEEKLPCTKNSLKNRPKNRRKIWYFSSFCGVFVCSVPIPLIWPERRHQLVCHLIRQPIN